MIAHIMRQTQYLNKYVVQKGIKNYGFDFECNAVKNLKCRGNKD